MMKMICLFRMYMSNFQKIEKVSVILPIHAKKTFSRMLKLLLTCRPMHACMLARNLKSVKLICKTEA